MKQAQQKNIQFVEPRHHKAEETIVIRKIWSWGCLCQRFYFVISGCCFVSRVL